MRRDASGPRRWRSASLPVCLVVASVLAACGTPPPSIDEDPAASASADGAGGDEPGTVAIAPACSQIAERSYQPPPEEQPPADPALTTAEAILDLPVEQPAEPEIIELEDGERVRIAPAAPQTPIGALQTEGPVQWPDHFGGVWGDARYGSMVVGFTDEVDRYAELVRERYGAAWWVVEVEHSEHELRELQDEIGMTELGPSDGPGSISSTASGTGPLNRVTIGILEPTDDRLAELSERYGADRICFEIERTPTDDDAEVAPWEPAPGADLSPATTRIEVLVNERACSGGTSAEGRIAPPTIEYEAETVTITLAVIPVTGPAPCPGNPDTPYTVELDEPLGDRTILDGGTSPPAPPSLHEER